MASASTLLGMAVGVCLAALLVATGAAVLRYRLYDLDRIISRTLAVVDQTMQPTTAWVWLRPGQAGSGPAGPPRPQPSTR